MANPLHKVGDIVQLKSGGPKMTIRQLHKGIALGDNDFDPHVNYSCQWFSGSKLEDGVFPERSLQLPEVDDKTKKQG